MDPVTFGLIVTALSGVSAVLGIGQTGLQLFHSRKRVHEIVEEDSFIDLSVIERRGDRKNIQAIVTELRKTARQANNIMKDMQRRIILRALIYTGVWLLLILVVGWAVAFSGEKLSEKIGITLIFIYLLYGGSLVLASVILLNKFLPSVLSRKFELVDLSETQIREVINRYNERAKMQVEKSFRMFGLLRISEQEMELVDRYLNVVSALRIIQAQALLLSLKEAEKMALGEMEKLASKCETPNSETQPRQ